MDFFKVKTQDYIQLNNILIIENNYKNVEELLNKGADPNIQDVLNWSPLMYASINGHVDMVKLLLIYGAKTNIKNNDGNTALMLTLIKKNEIYNLKNQTENYTKCIDLLLKYDDTPLIWIQPVKSIKNKLFGCYK